MTECNRGMRRHNLLTKEIRGRLPKIGETDGKSGTLAQVKFFSPYSNWTWWATEFDGDDIFFGLVHGFEVEYGSFSYSELAETMVQIFGTNVPAIERDCNFTPRDINEIAIEQTNMRYDR